MQGSVFKNDGKHFILIHPYVEFYIPSSYFNSSKQSYATDYGQTINTIGIFNFGVFTNGKSTIKTMNIPTWIELRIYDSETRVIDLPGNPGTECKVIKYYNGNIIMDSTFIVDSSNAELFLKFVLDGKLPSTIPYTKTLEMWRKNMEMNNVHFGVSSAVLEIVLSSIYRDKNDLTRKFSKVIGKDPEHISEFDYLPASIRKVCQYTSTFTAITFEDMDSMITTSLNRSRENKPETPSPLEAIIKM